MLRTPAFPIFPGPIFVGTILFGMAFAAHANTLYKCADAKGAIAFQSEPCPANARTMATRDYIPEAAAPIPAPERTKASSTPIRIATTHRERRASKRTPRDIAKQRCQSAKLAEQAYRDRRGLDISFEQLRKISDRTVEACWGL
ncbi:MAG TPA: DUF4124 domain-containing protein [Arenimonas sp.]|uniref:DUF4124 domain-containing protein n=1 Tax=Arenimonas sp. TaxID=1872635 RepID=UPI002B6EC1CB|nr:DUF4124 domain-containing protein [Arenimonas sp.]HMB57475.1 DUF4124 domain-containing protein [Arenimonas sp.]